MQSHRLPVLLLTLASLCAMPACTTNTWSTRTETLRATGPEQRNTQTRPQQLLAMHYATQREEDGFRVEGVEHTDDAGRAAIELLAPAMQCLFYGHAVELRAWTEDERKPCCTQLIDAAEARRLVGETRVRARLGQAVLLREREMKLLSALRKATTDPELGQWLAEIEPRVQERPVWR